MTFTSHMAWHMLLVAGLVPAGCALVRGTRFDPVLRAPVMFSPLLACLIEFIVVWAWHVPALHDAARHHWAWWAAEQGSFAAAACYLWLSILGGAADRLRIRAMWSSIALALTFAHMTMLGVLVALAPRPLYAHTPGLVDQQMGGAVMIAAGALLYPLAALWLFRPLVQAPATEAR